MGDLAKSKKIRGGHRGYLKKILGQASGMLENFSEEVRHEASQIKEGILDSIRMLQKLDEEIVELIASDEASTEEDITKEVDDAGKVRADARKVLKRLEEKLHKDNDTNSIAESVVSGGSLSNESVPTASKVRAKLPKLEVKKFKGNVCKWQEFWDSFESSIHSNDCLSDVDKFNYLRGLLEESAKSCISGFSLTAANYKSAVEILKERYGKKSAVQRAHMQQLMKTERVKDERDLASLRRLCDRVETHYRGLEALGIEQNTYSSIVVPHILDCLPKSVCLIITRERDFHEWTVEDLLKPLKREIELREEHRESENKNNREIGDRPNWKRGQSSAHALLTKSKGEACAFCLGSHRHEDCSRVDNKEKRKELLRKYSRCFKCLRKGHLARNCNVKVTCSVCKGEHHASLCDQEKVSESKPKGPEVVGEESKVKVNTTLIVSPKDSVINKCSSKVALQTALAMLVGRKSGRVRVLLDSGSQKTFVTVRAAKAFGCEVVRAENLSIGTFGQGASGSELRNVVRLNLKSLVGKETVSVEAYVVPEITVVKNQHLEVEREHYAHLKDLWLSDVCKSSEDLEVDVLVGADYLWLLQKDCIRRGKPGEPVAIDTVLGWVVSGPIGSPDVEEPVTALAHFVSAEVRNSGVDISKFWDLESIGIKDQSSDVHESVISDLMFTGTRYSVGLPWRENHDPLPTNYDLSFKRMKGQIKRLSKDPVLLAEYDRIIKTQEEEGIIEKVKPTDTINPETKIHYVPHQAVVRKDAATTKVRIVYDASAKSHKSAVALNDCLEAGPSLNPLLFDILLRFREQRVAIVADIEKAFLNIEVHEKDRDSLRFLWVDNVLRNNLNLVVYRFCRVVFGVNSSPFLLNATLRHHISKYAIHDRNFADKLLRSFYVDDLATGEASTEAAYLLYTKAKERMNEGGFKLRKWRTNDSKLRAQIQESTTDLENKISEAEEQTYAKEMLACQTGGQFGKVLGLEWDCVRDLIRFEFDHLTEKAQNLEPTKRNVLSLLACIFDPLGLLSPTVAKAKILFQDICISGLDWDDVLTKSLKERWEKWLKDFSAAECVTVERYVCEPSDCLKESNETKFWLHGFGDASKRAYCAVVYLVTMRNNSVYVKLVASKTRVSPIKELSIPRLELMAARILAQLMNAVRQALESEYKFEGVRYWTDSKTVLCWISNTGSWKQFVQHRVDEILRVSSKCDWGHCPGIENPADLGSRGVLVTELKNSSLWWTGPPWLKGTPTDWPSLEKVSPTLESKVEEKKSFSVNLLINIDSLFGISNLINLQRFSSLKRLLRVTAWLKRFITNLRRKKAKKELVCGTLEVSELKRAELAWVKASQLVLKEQKEYKQLQRQFGLVEKEEILHCTGRLSNSELDSEAREPIVLPRKHKFTELVIAQCHESVMHGGVRSTLAQLRTKYWTAKGRQEVKRVINACLVCKRWNCKACTKPQQAALPEFRVKRAAPFENSGVDFAGPMFAKTKSGMSKVYIALFTCCVTRAVHLELVHDLTAATFLRCLRRFVGRRGAPKIMVSDNAKTFKAAAKALRELYTNKEVKNSLTNKGIDWRFNLERAPWWGGFFERLIGLVKVSLRKVLGNSRLTFDELRTVLVEVEANLNARPLTYEYDEVSNEVLTPSHLLYGRRITTLPDSTEVDVSELGQDSSKKNSIVRFKYLSTILEHFWSRWKREYLANLREFHKIGVPERESVVVKPGDVVIVYEQGKKRGEWKTGVVKELIEGKDKIVRGAKVCVMKKGRKQVLCRPCVHLYPVEMRNVDVDDVAEVVGDKMDRVDEKDECVGRRLKRNAAVDARWKTKAMLDS